MYKKIIKWVNRLIDCMIWMSIIYIPLWIIFWLIPQEKNRYKTRERVYTIEQSDMKKLANNLSKMGLDDSHGGLQLDDIFNDTLKFNSDIYRRFYPMYIEKKLRFECYIDDNNVTLNGICKYDKVGHCVDFYCFTQFRDNSIFKQYRVARLFEDTVLRGVRYECKPIVWSWWWLIGNQYDFYMLFGFIPYLIVLSIWGYFRLNRVNKKKIAPHEDPAVNS